MLPGLNTITDAEITAEDAYLITKGPKSSKALGKLPSEFYKKEDKQHSNCNHKI